MKKGRFAKEQITGFFKEAEAGHPVQKSCRSERFSDVTFYRWRAKYGSMEVSDARRLKDLEAGNARLKRLPAEAHLDIDALKGVFGVKH